MKFIILQADGMPDRPLKQLDNKTPLEVAKTPTINRILEKSEVGSVNHIPKGFKSGSDVGNLSVLGYDPVKFFTGRSPLEAESIGINLGKNDITFRCNLVNIVNINESSIMEDYSAGHIKTEKAHIIINYLKKFIDNKNNVLYPGVSYRHILVSRNPIDQIETTPPHDILEKDIDKFLPNGSDSSEIISIMKVANKKIKDFKDEFSQFKNEKVSDIWLWGEGKKTILPNFEEINGINGSVISAVDLVKGIGKCAGLDVINVPGATGYLDTNYAGKVKAGIQSLINNDFLMLHIEAPDETGHEGDYQKKIQAIEDLDSKVLKPLIDELDSNFKDYRLCIVSDHPTPIELRTHSYEYVPYIIYEKNSNLSNHNFKNFTESIVGQTENIINDGYKLLNRLFSN